MPRTLVASARRAGAVVAAVALLALTACTGGGEAVTPTPDESPTAVVTESPSASPTPTALTEEDVLAALPEAAAAEDVVGAVTFATYFLENYHQIRSEQPDLFDAITSPTCEFCLNVDLHYETSSAQGHDLIGGAVQTTVDHSRSGLQQDGSWGVEMQFDAEDVLEVDPAGETVRVSAGGTGLATVFMEWDGHFVVTYVGTTVEE